ncbi:insecticidal delta-endotoxin Cry8Ea1 family protein, partial [Bacillus cereus]|uniref:insecticidal delta-endotoxin Cry8Ea1 family protein n=1 Tax=Bacillus cereus TaxID=1396 RepID=UPI0005CEA6B9
MDIENRKKYEEVRCVSNDTNLKYPLESNPTIQIQNMNDRGCLNIIQKNCQELESLTSARSAPAAIDAAVNIAATVLGIFQPAAGAALSVINTLTGLLWPGDTSLTWEEFMKQGEDLINQAITTQIKGNALDELESIRLAVDNYSKYLADWVANPSVDVSADVMKKSYQDTIDYISVRMNYFSKANYEVALLPTYVQAANLHLTVLKDITIFGKDWGYGQIDIDFFYKEQFLKKMKVYSDYCVKWYKEGLNKLPKSTSTDWLEYNRYRREMTLMVLDIVALFPSYDGFLYTLPTNTQLTRVVYTNPKGGGPVDWKFFPITFSSIESLIRPPQLFAWLNSMVIKTKQVSTEGGYGVCYWSGSDLDYTYTGQTTSYTITNGSSGSYSSRYDILGKDVYQTLLYESSSREFDGLDSSEIVGNEGGTFNMVSEDGSTSSFKSAVCGIGEDGNRVDSESELPPDTLDSSQSNKDSYTHRLYYYNTIAYNRQETNTLDIVSLPLLGWTHKSVQRKNILFSDRITQLSPMKGFDTYNTSIIQGPGFWGGDIIANDDLSYLSTVNLKVEIHSTKKYRCRIQYAADTDGVFNIRIHYNGITIYNLEQAYAATMNPGESLTYSCFEYLEFPEVKSINGDVGVLEVRTELPNNSFKTYWSKIEFIPVEDNYELRIQLENAKKAVNTLFTAGRNALKLEVTDYSVDQASILVDCVSEELFPNEKRELQNLVKYAKRLSYSRNLLVDSTFDSINSPDMHGWYGSNGIAIGNGDFVFKGRYVNLPGTNDEQYPTYLYQKIDESKLKEYTRYKLRGFIESSRDLEVYVIRYDARHETLDVSNNLLPGIPSVNACGEPDRCAQQSLYKNPPLEQSLVTNGVLDDPHAFSLNIDTGSIDLNESLGIWVLFKISTSKGYAKLGNVEVIEERPLSGEALSHVKRKETKWRNKLSQLRTETQAIYTRAKQAIDNLFADAQDTKLKIGATFATIVAARKIVQSIREVYMPWLSVVPGVNYSIFTELMGRIQRAIRLYDLRNVVRNGRFLNGVSDWVVTSDVKVQEEDGNSVLVLSNWDAQVLQCVKLYPEHGYILRVTARKEGLGEGYVT